MHVQWQQMPARLELKMPVWTPGSYLIREYARHVQDFAVKSGRERSRHWRKINKNTWQIDTAGAQRDRRHLSRLRQRADGPHQRAQRRARFLEQRRDC